MNEADRWNDTMYHTPMIITDTGEHAYIGDIVEFSIEDDEGDLYTTVGKITAFWMEVL